MEFKGWNSFEDLAKACGYANTIRIILTKLNQRVVILQIIWAVQIFPMDFNV